MSRIMLYHCQEAEEHALLEEDLSFVCCDDSEEMLVEAVLHPPDVVVCEVRPGSVADLAVLRLLRRVAPRVPLVLVGEGPALEWDSAADLAPLYRATLPVEECGLRDAVHHALAGHGSAAG